MINKKNIPKSVIERIPLYADYIKSLEKEKVKIISASRVAIDLGLGEVQVRKDLNIIAGNGKPKIGYFVLDLREKIEKLISQKKINRIIVIGAGNIGKALVMYDGFEKDKFNIVGLFDNDESIIGQVVNNHKILSVNELNKFCDIDIAVIAVPNDVAQNVADLVVSLGIKGILNFTNQKLIVKDDVKVKNIDILSLLTILLIEQNNQK